MKDRPYGLYASDMLESMARIERYVKGLSYNEFVRSEIVIDAVIRNLEVMGEAAKNVPDEVKDAHPEIPWKRIVGLRNIVIHDYLGIDLENIWRIATKNIPEAGRSWQGCSSNVARAFC